MIRACLIGFGMAGRVFHGPLLSSVEGLELAAVVERNSSNAAQRYPGMTTHRTLESALADPSLDLFVVATPSGTHFDVTRQVLEAGKPVVVDKPMSPTAVEIAQLIELESTRDVPLIPFMNRRWDSDFQTIAQVLNRGSLGKLVYFESRFDRWRPDPPSNRLWKEDPAQGGGVLLDLGTHLADQALTLFGKPEAISADILCERPWARVNDAFTLRLRYPNFAVVLASNSLSMPPGPRFKLRGTKANYIKLGLDPQEAALNQITTVTDPNWGAESPESWGNLFFEEAGKLQSRPVHPIPGDYRLFYAGVRDALLGKALAPTKAIEAWRTARLLEWATESSHGRREIKCDWTNEPA